jgi:4-hydroxybenzoate polyprenyltransferase
MLHDALLFARERSPLGFVAILSLLLFSSGLMQLDVNAITFCSGWLTMFLFLFLVRLSDDICDIPIDRITHPQRGLCSGKIHLGRINRFRALAVVIMLALQATHLSALLFVLASVTFFALFFYLKPRLPTVVHVVILNFSLAVFPVYCGVLLNDQLSSFHLLMGLFVGLGGVAHDFSHSLLDTRGVPAHTLNPINRINQKVLAWWSLLLFLGSAVAGASLVIKHDAGWGFAACLALAGCILVPLMQRLIANPNAKTAKPFYVFGFVFFLLPILGHLGDLGWRYFRLLA